ncbi:MAG: hypothetical protein CMO01_28000 [Thalassobius sp.]|nr:hypothetical protein [Thalassovita sp.]
MKSLLLTFCVLLSYCTWAQDDDTNMYKADEKAIIETLNKETAAYENRNFEEWSKYWIHQPYSALTYTFTRGWDDVEKMMKMSMENDPDAMTNLEVKKDFNIRISGDLAYATFRIDHVNEDGEVTGTSRSYRVLEKEDGMWKMVLVDGYNQSMEKFISMKAADLLDKVINYYDPENSWASFTGSMNSTWLRADGSAVNERFDIRNPDDFYQCTRFENGNIAIKGMEDGNYFASLNGMEDISEDNMKKYELSEDATNMFYAHHRQHFALPMELKNSGAKLNENIEISNINGANYFILTFVGEKDKVNNKYYEGETKLAVRPDDFSLMGMHFKGMNNGEEMMFYSNFEGEINLNNLKVPRHREVYNYNPETEKYEFMGSDNFSEIILPK